MGKAMAWIDTSTKSIHYHWDGNEEIKVYCKKELIHVIYVPGNAPKTWITAKALVEAYKRQIDQNLMALMSGNKVI